MTQPPHWGKDPLSRFLEDAQNNIYATFVNLKPLFEKLQAIDQIYRRLVDNSNNSPNWFPALFVLRAHSTLLTAIRTSLSGQVPETFLLLRGTMENALYGFYLAERPELSETWIRRHDDLAFLKAVRSEISNLHPNI